MLCKWGVESLENMVFQSGAENVENVFLIDWLTVVFHGMSVSQLLKFLSLDDVSIPWHKMQAFRNGYPLQQAWNNITIRSGADDPKYYDDPSKARTDMGICLDVSGSGCRALEQYAGVSDWSAFFQRISESGYDFNITRLDLAFDDHTGILDLKQLELDTRLRNYRSCSRKAMIIWSDDQDNDLQGLTIEIGSRRSPVLVRIYDKASERGFDSSKHWVRVEIQLRKERALCAFAEVAGKSDIGTVASGILLKYCCFLEPSETDSNKARWDLADYWQKLLVSMEKISLCIAPGEPYNFRKTEHYMLEQYGQAFVTYWRIHGETSSFLMDAMKRFPKLSLKYETAIQEAEFLEAERRRRIAEARYHYGFDILDADDPDAQLDFAECFGWG